LIHDRKPLTAQDEIARLIGASRESVARVARFELAVSWQLGRRTVTMLDVNALTSVAG